MRRLLAVLSLAAIGTAQSAGNQVTRDLAGKVSAAAAVEPIATKVRVSCWRLDMHRGTIDPLCDGMADPDGSFAFRAVPWLQGHDWGFNTMVLVARAGRDAVGLREVRGDEVDVGKLEVRLLPTATLRGVVRDGHGKPVAGAAVWPWMFGPPCQVWLTAPMMPWRTQTAADGSFELPGLPAGVKVSLAIRHPDFAEARPDAGEASERCEVELQPGAAIAGRVLFAGGKPAARVPVSAQAVKGNGWQRVWTDSDGRYKLQSLPEAAYNVWAEAEGFTVVAIAALPASAGTPAAAPDLVLVHGGFVVGRVVDPSGKPVQPGTTADVAMYGPARPRNGGGGCECSPVLPDGSFRLRAPAGTAFVYLRPGGGWVEATSGMEVEVVDGQETVVEFRAQPGKARER